MVESVQRSALLLSYLLQIQNENLSTGTPSHFRYYDKAYEIAYALSHLQGIHTMQCAVLISVPCPELSFRSVCV